jgi:hypothetical protein
MGASLEREFPLLGRGEFLHPFPTFRTLGLKFAPELSEEDLEGIL